MRRTPLNAESLEAREVPAAMVSQIIPNVAGDQFGYGIALVDTGTSFSAFLAGRTSVNEDGVVNKFNMPYSLGGGSQVFGNNWPGQAGTDGFHSVAATASGVYAAGISYSQTTDSVGGKEHKGVMVGFTPTGTANWVRQAPNAPGAFTYGGYESINDTTAVVENGTTVLYGTGSSQSNGVNGGRLFLTKVTAGGSVVWTRTDSAITPNSDGYDIAAANGSVYVAGLSNDDGTRRGYVKKYDANGNLAWAKTSAAGMFTSVVADAAGNIYLAGNTNGTTTDFLVEKWDAAGTVLFSRTFDRSGAADSVNSLALLGGRLYGVGETRGGTAGGSDGIVLTFDPANGNLLEQNLWGGAQDDSLQDVTPIGNALHVAGTTRGNGADMAYTVWTVNQAPTDVTLSPAAVFENLLPGTPVGTLAAVDPNAGDAHTFTLVSGTGGTDNAQFRIVGDQLQTAASFDYEAKSSYSVRVRATDGGGLWVERALTVAVTDVNEAPSFAFATPTLIVPNNTVPQSVLSWVVNRQNPEAGQTFTFEMLWNTDPTLFATQPTLTPDGTLNYAPAPNTTGVATIAVRLRDSGGTANGGVDVSPMMTFNVEVVGANLALNTAQSGQPSPLASDAGWGGGSNPWDIADGRRSYPTWARGLAFTGGSGNWAGPAGVRQITIDLAAARFDQVLVWHHGADHTPAVATLEYFDATGWHPITFARQLNASLEYGAGSGSSWADRYTFAAVTGSKVRWSFDNRGLSITGQQVTHGWVYEFEVIAAPAPVVTTIASTFDTDDDGWRVTEPAQGGSGIPDYLPTGGNLGGYLSASDPTRGLPWYWVAPAKFHTDAAGTFGKFLNFDLKQGAQPLQDTHDDVILRGGRMTLVVNLPAKPGTAWTSYAIPLDARGGWVHQGTTTPATDDEIRAVLSKISDLRIRGKYLAGGSIGGLDSVVLGGDPPTVSILDGAVAEGHTGLQMLSLTVRMSAITTAPVTVEFSTSDDTATTADSDYITARGTVTFAPGETTQTVQVQVRGDVTVEQDETINVWLDNAKVATIADDMAVGVILNDDAVGGGGGGGGGGLPPRSPREALPPEETLALKPAAVLALPVESDVPMSLALPVVLVVEPWEGFGLGDDEGIFFARV